MISSYSKHNRQWESKKEERRLDPLSLSSFPDIDVAHRRYQVLLRSQAEAGTRSPVAPRLALPVKEWMAKWSTMSTTCTRKTFFWSDQPLAGLVSSRILLVECHLFGLWHVYFQDFLCPHEIRFWTLQTLILRGAEAETCFLLFHSVSWSLPHPMDSPSEMWPFDWWLTSGMSRFDSMFFVLFLQICNTYFVVGRHVCSCFLLCIPCRKEWQ